MENVLKIFRDKIAKFYFDEIPPSEFENWLYGISDLEKAIGSEDYLILISFDFKNKKDVDGCRKFIEVLYQKLFAVSIILDRALSISKLIVSDKISINIGCQILAGISDHYPEIVPISFELYYDELERNGEQGLAFYKPQIIDAARKLMEKLKSN